MDGTRSSDRSRVFLPSPCSVVRLCGFQRVPVLSLDGKDEAGYPVSFSVPGRVAVSLDFR